MRSEHGNDSSVWGPVMSKPISLFSGYSRKENRVTSRVSLADDYDSKRQAGSLGRRLSIVYGERGGGCPTTTSSRRHPTPPGATQRRLTTPNATFGSQMARFARPYCATEPVRTVPFFNLYDDIQITQLGAASRGRGVPRPSDVPAAPETRWGGFAQPQYLVVPPRPPRCHLTTPNATSRRHFGRFAH